LLAGRQLHAGRSVFLLQYDWWPAGRVSSASALAQWAPKLQDFRNAECDLVGPIYRGGDALSIFIRRNEVTMCRRAEGTSARSFVRMTNFRYRRHLADVVVLPMSASRHERPIPDQALRDGINRDGARSRSQTNARPGRSTTLDHVLGNEILRAHLPDQRAVQFRFAGALLAAAISNANSGESRPGAHSPASQAGQSLRPSRSTENIDTSSLFVSRARPFSLRRKTIN
jgi:hypothetical protein